MKNGGEIANRGFIFQAVIALIECLDPKKDWDRIKNEPKTDEDKVDIKLYKGERELTAIQVKSSINPFERADVKRWLEDLKGDAEDAEDVILCLVGDTFTPACQTFIEESGSEIKTVSFKNLQKESTYQLIEYIKKAGLGKKVRIDDLELIDESLFSKILRNSTAKEPVSREEFEETFQRAIPQGEELAKQIADVVSGHINKAPGIPQCLTPIPLIDKETGLVGRENILKEIRKMLDENACIVLVNGLGGIGKTAVMQGICNELKAEGHYVAWISCGDSLQDDLLMLREAFGVPKEEKADEAYIIVKAKIQQLGRKLYLFMDNLSRDVKTEERDEINGLGVHVMITSRAENLPFPKKKLEYLNEENAVKMFQGYFGRESGDEETVLKIVRAAGRHTLLVELLANAAREEGGTLDEFNKKLEEGLFYVSEEELETEHDDENRTIEESVIKLYEISPLSKEQQRIMKLFTIFTPEKEIYYKVRDWAGFDKKELKKLVNRGWIERGGLENGYHIHQIVRDSIGRQMERNGEKVRLEDYGAFLDNVINTQSYLKSPITYDIVRERLVLTEDVARFFAEGDSEDAAAGDLYHNMAVVYSNQGEYKRALEYYGRALAIRLKMLGTNNPDTAMTYNDIGLVYNEQGEYEKALIFYEKALVIREQVLGQEHPDTAITYDNIASLYHDQGEYEKALIFYEKALVIREHVLGQEHSDTAISYNNIATVYLDKGEYDKTLEFLEKALAIEERVLGTGHPDTALTYQNIASAFHMQGEYEEALEFYGKALVISERVLGTEHPFTAKIYNNMAAVFYNQGDYPKALEYGRKALAIGEQLLGTEHPDTAATYSNIAKVFHSQGEFSKALAYYTKAYAVFLLKLGENHPRTQKVKRSISDIENLLSSAPTSDQP